MSIIVTSRKQSMTKQETFPCGVYNPLFGALKQVGNRLIISPESVEDAIMY